MVYTYTPAYYSSFQDTLTSLCKSILLPFSHKNRCLPADHKLAKRQSDNLKWQQDSFHRILNLIGLHKEGIVAEADVSAFRSHLLDTLIASPSEPEPVALIRDKLLFLQELFYAKCISTDEYHSSKRPLLQRLAVQGAEIDCKDVIMGDASTVTTPDEEWSVIELGDKESPSPAEKSKHRTPMMSFMPWKSKDKREPPGAVAANNESTGSILIPEAAPPKPDKPKRKPFRSLFDKEQKDENANVKQKKQWGLDGFRKWKNEPVTEPTLLSENQRSDDAAAACTLVASPMGEGPDTRSIKKKIHSDGSSSDFFIDKVLGDNIKKELSRIQSELSATHPNLALSDDQMDAISTRLPVDKADLKSFFPKSWCDRYGDIVLDVVKKEFKNHVGELEARRSNTREKNGVNSARWVEFEDNVENFRPNLFRDHPALNLARNGDGGEAINGGGGGCYVNNPFMDGHGSFWAARN